MKAKSLVKKRRKTRPVKCADRDYNFNAVMRVQPSELYFRKVSFLKKVFKTNTFLKYNSTIMRSYVANLSFAIMSFNLTFRDEVYSGVRLKYFFYVKSRCGVTLVACKSCHEAVVSPKHGKTSQNMLFACIVWVLLCFEEYFVDSSCAY